MYASGHIPPLDIDVRFYRRIWPQWIAEHKDPIRPGSVAFKDGRGEVSLFRADLTTAEAVIKDWPNHSLVTIDFGTIRRLGLSVLHRPEEGGIAHYVLDPHPTGRQSKLLAKAAEWVEYRGPSERES